MKQLVITRQIKLGCVWLEKKNKRKTQRQSIFFNYILWNIKIMWQCSKQP